MGMGLQIWIGFQQDLPSFCIVYLPEVFPNVVFPFQSYLSCLLLPCWIESLQFHLETCKS